MADTAAHFDCNRTGEIQTVDPETGEVRSEHCPGCAGFGLDLPRWLAASNKS